MGGTLSSTRVAFCGLFVVAACQRPSEPVTTVTPGDSGAQARIAGDHEPASPFQSLAQGSARRALAEARGLRGQCKPSTTYLALRRAVARGKAWWRLSASEPAETLLGPRSPVLESGGHLSGLDTALIAGDCAGARNAQFQVEQSLRLIELQLTRPSDARQAVRALCDMAIDLGQVILESHAEVATTENGVLADAEGTLDGIEQGIEALRAPLQKSPPSAAVARARKRIQSLRAALLAARSTRLSSRGLLVLETGELGALLRLMARESGFSIAPAFSPKIATANDPALEPVNALSVPASRSPVDSRWANLGKLLFSDRRLSKDRNRACSSCHKPELAFTDGKTRASSLLEGVTLRNTPTLLYASAQAAQLWDGRVLTSRSQALRVIHAPAEMGVSESELEQRLREDRELAATFSQINPDGVTATAVARALSEYQRAELVPARAPIDRFARGELAALSRAELDGLDVFAGPGRCARCHVPPLFSGTRPNDFSVTVYASLGTTTDARGTALDPDRGRYLVTKNPADDGVFKTPTVRNVALTAPYFHHGGFSSLADVIDFYVKGGGRSFGHTVENQDPDVRVLKLTAKERSALLVFLRRSLTDPRQ